MEQGIYKMMKKNIFIISFIILLAALGFITVQNTEAALGDFLNFAKIPAHPLLEKVEERQSIINGEKAKTIIYKADNNLDIPKIINFYKDVLMQKGWKKSQEYLSADYSVVGFMDEEWRVFTLTVGRLPLIEGVIVTVFYLPGGMKGWIFKENTEDNDMPGKDFSWLPRYPGANRIQCIEDYTGVVKIDYIIIGYSCIDCVKEFYKGHMLNSGWRLIGSDHQNKNQIKEVRASSATRTKKILSQLTKDGKLKNIDLEKYETYLGTQEMPSSEIYSFHFEKKGAVCALGISYKETQAGCNMAEEQMNKFLENAEEMGEEASARNEEYIKEYLSKIRPYYYQTQSNKESVMISVIYMPKESSGYSPNKRLISNFKIRRK